MTVATMENNIVEPSEIVMVPRDPLWRRIELSVVIPTLNERDNIVPLIKSLQAALGGVHWEAIFVDDDSLDGTSDLLREIAQYNPQIRIIRRAVLICTFFRRD
jgi:Glycosyl transferase family 2